ncbi:hypothetical protein E1B28_008291 [Marasmius oreades]|uniref:F-box domain-containing protein n=1 Tax=Marasmius oreades TaxID=181124 RepID=A0A9P7RY76_9AGAR|nr:uncharacterized protein E1B28_008291 [Marasmius oreades]KAG7091890.1 hypothetical protein E1B28_008291 [Marasmius oreades]
MRLTSCAKNLIRTAIKLIPTNTDAMNTDTTKSVLPEVWAHIFKLASSPSALYPGVLPRVVKLSMVCGHWREVIYSTPSLWTNITLDVDRWTQSAATDGVTRLTYVLQLFLDRSNSAPLNLHLTMRSSVPVHPTTKLLDVLSQSMNRWKTVYLNIPPEIFEHPALQLLPQRLSSLQHVGLSDLLSDHHVNLFNDCPSLTSLELSWWHATPYRFQQEWLGIKTLDINILSLQTVGPATFISSFLKVCPNLENLSFFWGSSRSDLESLEVVVSRFNLKSLTLNGARGLFSLFQHLSLPDLSTMNLEIFDMRWDLKIFADFLSRSGCSITHLTLRSPFAIFIESIMLVLSFLRLLPSVQELCLNVRSRNRVLFVLFLDELFVGQSSLSSPLLPHLTDLTLILDEDSFEEGPLVRAVTSRWHPDLEDATEVGVACLRSLRLEMMNNKSVPTLEPLLYLRNAGLKLRVDVTLRSE